MDDANVSISRTCLQSTPHTSTRVPILISTGTLESTPDPMHAGIMQCFMTRNAMMYDVGRTARRGRADLETDTGSGESGGGEDRIGRLDSEARVFRLELYNALFAQRGGERAVEKGEDVVGIVILGSSGVLVLDEEKAAKATRVPDIQRRASDVIIINPKTRLSHNRGMSRPTPINHSPVLILLSLDLGLVSVLHSRCTYVIITHVFIPVGQYVHIELHFQHTRTGGNAVDI
ncbi:hypothetical protein CVT25_012001 [Psilocybe cyanescens]|uniref:Uncharacterized protein n=1 Tax=Psilocybe cyanescens TaxID=93625 RepID=A0A409XFR8_PSICY|nr:hypothetical protein CVT25_012001 [Psilocybe cyanescens]